MYCSRRVDIQLEQVERRLFWHCLLYRRYTVPCHASQGVAGRAHVTRHSRAGALAPSQMSRFRGIIAFFFCRQGTSSALSRVTASAGHLSPCVTQGEGWALYTGGTVVRLLVNADVFTLFHTTFLSVFRDVYLASWRVLRPCILPPVGLVIFLTALSIASRK
jgi:hypothetical protein